MAASRFCDLLFWSARRSTWPQRRPPRSSARAVYSRTWTILADHKEWAGGRPATMIWSSSSVDSTSRTPILRATLRAAVTRRCSAPLLRAALQRLCRAPQPCPPPTSPKGEPKGGFGLSHSSRSWSGDKSFGLTLKPTKHNVFSPRYASARASSLSSRRKNLPVAVFGSSSINSIWRGYL
jgi:hypothetical protein